LQSERYNKTNKLSAWRPCLLCFPWLQWAFLTVPACVCI